MYEPGTILTTWNDNLSTNLDRSFGYDALDRLTSATAPNMWKTLSFTYDELGNRESRTLDGQTTIYTYSSSNNRLATLTGAEQSSFTYDDAGRLATEARERPEVIFTDDFESGGTGAWGSSTPKSSIMITNDWVYTFNAADQLTQVSRDGTVVLDASYDGDNLRVVKTLGDTSTFYLRNPEGNTLAEYNQDGVLIAEYVYANGRQIAKVTPDGIGGDTFRFFHADHLGSVLSITDEIGSQVWSGEYFPFGSEYSSGDEPDRYRFTQHELDYQTGFLYAKARYYHPGLGRFISTDPVGGNSDDPQSWNRYSYVQNNPVNATDPTGEMANWAAGALIGAAIGGGGELARQLLAGEGLNGRDIFAAAAGGLVSGAIAGGTFGASLVARIGVRGAAVVGAVANAVGGAVQRELDSSGETQACSAALFVDAAVGGIGGAVGHTAQVARVARRSQAIGSLQTDIARRNEIVGGRLARGVPPMSAGAKLLRDQARLAGERKAAETLGTVVGTATTNALAPIVIQQTTRSLE